MYTNILLYNKESPIITTFINTTTLYSYMMNEKLISKVTEGFYTTTIIEGLQTEGNKLFKRQYKTVTHNPSWESCTDLISSVGVTNEL